MENFTRKGAKIRMAAIFAAYPGNPFRPVGASCKLLQTVEDAMPWVGVGFVHGKRTTDNGLDYPFPMWNIDSHTYTYEGKWLFTCNFKKNVGGYYLTHPLASIAKEGPASK